MLERMVDRIARGSKTPEGKVIAILLTITLALMTWNTTAIGVAFADDGDNVPASEAGLTEVAEPDSTQVEAVEGDEDTESAAQLAADEEPATDEPAVLDQEVDPSAGDVSDEPADEVSDEDPSSVGDGDDAPVLEEQPEDATEPDPALAEAAEQADDPESAIQTETDEELAADEPAVLDQEGDPSAGDVSDEPADEVSDEDPSSVGDGDDAPALEEQPEDATEPDPTQAEAVEQAEDPEPVVETDTDEQPATDAPSVLGEEGDQLLDGALGELVAGVSAEESSADPDDVEAEVEPEYVATTLQGTVNGVTVTVDVPEGALPEGVEMQLRDVTTQSILERVDAVTDYEVAAVQAIDISFWFRGVEIEPKIPVGVVFDNTQVNTQDTDVFHVNDYTGAIEELPAADVTTATADTVSFEAKDFSVYVVVEGVDPDARLMVNFYQADGETLIATMSLTKTQLDAGQMNTNIYDPGIGEMSKGQVFKGWTQNASFDVADADSGLTIADIRDKVAALLNAGTVTDGQEINFYAMVFESNHISYIDELGVTIYTDEVLFKSGATEIPYTVEFNYTPYYVTGSDEDDETKAANFDGWKQMIPEETPAPVYDNGTELNMADFDLSESDLTLSLMAQVAYGHWLVFNENGSGATFTPPLFVGVGETPDEAGMPQNPTRTGYQFQGWYKNQACTETFDATETITATTNIYAKWSENSTASYTVLIWAESLTGGYDFVKSIKITDATTNSTMADAINGTVGDTTITVNGEDVFVPFADDATTACPGFKYEKYDTNNDGKVASNNTSVLNVYFERQTYTLKFYYARSQNGNYQVPQVTTVAGTADAFNGTGGTWLGNGNTLPGSAYGQTEPGTESRGRYTYYYKTLTAEYGEYIGNKWPTYNGTDFATWNNYRAGSWSVMPTAKVYTVNGQGTVKGKITVMDEQILGDLTSADGNYVFANYDRASSQYTWTYHIFFQDVSGGGYTRYEDVTAYSHDSGGNWQSQQHPPTYPGMVQSSAVKVNNALEIIYYYDRLSYPLLLMDGIYVTGGGDQIKNLSSNTLKAFQDDDAIIYGGDVSSYNDYDPTSLIDDGSEYVFLGWYTDDACMQPYTFSTMPEGGITVHAKWMLKEYKVALHPNDNGDTSFAYINGQPAGQYADHGSYRSDEFWLNNGEKVANVGGTRDLYDVIGWFTNENLTKVWDFDAFPLNDTIVAKYGTLYSDDEIDPDYPATVGEINLYANWRRILDGADGINVVYTAVGKDGEGNEVVGTDAPADPSKYSDQAQAIARPASKAPEANPPLSFQYWVVQKWDGTAYVDTDQTVLPGDRYRVNYDDSMTLVNEWVNPDNPGDVLVIPNPQPGTEPPDATHTKIKEATYTVQLRAQYGSAEDATPTHITWYNNYVNSAQGIVATNNLAINEQVVICDPLTRDGYKFLGWAKKPETNAAQTTTYYTYANLTEDDLFLIYDEENDKYTYKSGETVKDATAVFADESLPYDGLYAVWAEGVTVKKVWDDANNKDNARPDSVTVTLKAGNQTVGSAETLNADNQWTYTWAVPETTEQITAVEEDVTGYAATVSAIDQNRVITITNSRLVNGTGKVSVTKSWAGDSDVSTSRPDSVSVTLKAGGTAVGDPVDVTADNQWTYTWENLHKYNGNTEIVYSVVEDPVPTNYAATVEGNAANGFTVTNTYSPNPATIGPGQTSTAFGTKSLTATTADGREQTFEFTLAPVDNAPMPTLEGGAAASTTATVSFDAGTTGSKTIPFEGTITYTATGTYKYTVTETSKGTGWQTTYAPESKEVTVTVSDGGGTLTAEVTGVTITNAYTPTPATIDATSADFSKKVVKQSDYDIADQTCAFSISGVDESSANAPLPQDGSGAAVSSANVDINGAGEYAIGFGTISFDTVGTYTYTVTETGVTPGGEGWEIDGSNSATVKVVVTDGGGGSLSAQIQGGAAAITNKYNPTPAIEIVKTADRESGVKTDDVIEYTVVVTNSGNVTLDNVELVDTLVTLSADEAAIGTLDPEGTKTIKYTYTVTQADVDNGTIENTATVTGEALNVTQSGASVEVNDSANVTVTTLKTMTLSAEDGGGVYIAEPYGLQNVEASQAAATIEYSTDDGATWSTTAPAITDVADSVQGTVSVRATLDGYIPAQVDGLSIVVTPRSVALVSESDEKVYDGTPLTNSTVNVSGDGFAGTEGASYDVTGSQTLVGESANTFTYTLNEGTEASNYNISTTEGVLKVTDGTNPGENAIDPDLYAKKSHEGTEYALGDTIQWTIEVTNIYDEPKDITLTEQDGVTLDQSLFEAVPAGETITATATKTVTQADIEAGEINNTVNVKFGNLDEDVPDPDPIIPVKPEPKTPAIEVTKTADKSTYSEVGEVITYTITVANTGETTVADINVEDILEGAEFPNGSSIASLEPGESGAVEATYAVTEEDIDRASISNTAYAAGTDPDGNPVGDETDEPTVVTYEPMPVPPTPNPHMTLTKSVESTPADGNAYLAGEVIEYAITVLNDGDVALVDVVVVDELEGFEWNSDVDPNIGDLAVGQSVTLYGSYEVTEDDAAAGSVVNTATATGKSENSGDPDPTVTPGSNEQPTGKQYKITYKLNGGVFGGSSEDIVELYAPDTVIKIHAAPTREGYTFDYWEGSAYQPNDEYTVTGDHTFTAQWKKVEPVTPDKPDPKKDPVLPVTGDQAPILALVFMTLLGLGLVLIACTRAYRRNRG